MGLRRASDQAAWSNRGRVDVSRNPIASASPGWDAQLFAAEDSVDRSRSPSQLAARRTKRLCRARSLTAPRPGLSDPALQCPRFKRSAAGVVVWNCLHPTPSVNRGTRRADAEGLEPSALDATADVRGLSDPARMIRTALKRTGRARNGGGRRRTPGGPALDRLKSSLSKARESQQVKAPPRAQVSHAAQGRTPGMSLGLRAGSEFVNGGLPLRCPSAGASTG